MSGVRVSTGVFDRARDLPGIQKSHVKDQAVCSMRPEPKEEPTQLRLELERQSPWLGDYIY